MPALSNILRPLSSVTTSQIAASAVTAEKLSGGQSGNAPIYGCRAWVNFDATRNASGGSDSANTNRFINAAGNVSSVLKTSTGNYTINFTTSMPTTSYAVSFSSSTDDFPSYVQEINPPVRALSSVNIAVLKITNPAPGTLGSAQAADKKSISCTVFC